MINLTSKPVRLGIVLALLGTAFGMLVYGYQDEFGYIFDHADALLTGFLIMQIFIFAANMINAVRIRDLILQDNIATGIMFKAVNLAYGLNILFPGRASELIKPVYFKQTFKLPFDKGLTTVFLEKIFDLIFVLFIALYSLSTYHASNAYIFIILGSLMTLTLTFLKPLETLITDIIRLIPFSLLRSFVSRSFVHTLELRYHPKFIKVLITTLAAWVISIAQYYFFINYVGSINLTLGQIITVFTLTTIGGVVAVLPAGIGTYEAAFVISAGIYGYEFSEALIIGILLHLSTILQPLLISIFILTTERSGISNLLSEIKIKLDKR